MTSVREHSDISPEDTLIESLGPGRIPSPLNTQGFVDDRDRVLLHVCPEQLKQSLNGTNEPLAFTKAGPRKHVYFDPSKLKVALVTCGGLCPGLNNVLRSVVLTLYHTYSVRNIFGIQYGLQGFIPRYGRAVWELNPDRVTEIHAIGGTVLGSSRGPQDIDEIVDALERMNVGIVFVIGGDGSFRAAGKIAAEARDRNAKIGVIGIPKTIDNDINFVSRSFGFNTAVSMATQAIASAHVEARGFPNGVGLVKLMGRHSGFIAATAALAKRDTNLVLVPEADFDIDGDHGLLAWLEERLHERKHAVIVVAEGAGQKYCDAHGADESGNARLGDIGQVLKDRITEHFKTRDIELNLKYIDPSYMIRSVPADSEDAVYCGFLGQNAVHAGMAGKTNMFVGTWNSEFVYIPLKLATMGRKSLDLNDSLWLSVLEATGQPSLLPPAGASANT